MARPGTEAAASSSRLIYPYLQWGCVGECVQRRDITAMGDIESGQRIRLSALSSRAVVLAGEVELRVTPMGEERGLLRGLGAELDFVARVRQVTSDQLALDRILDLAVGV